MCWPCRNSRKRRGPSSVTSRFGKYDGRPQVAQTEHPAGGALGVFAGASAICRRDEASKWRTKFDGRLAAPWTCLVVVLIAIPFGAASGRRNLFFGVAGSIFICFGFFVVQQFSLALGSGGYMPPWLAAWLPNMIFAGLGLLLTARVR